MNYFQILILIFIIMGCQNSEFETANNKTRTAELSFTDTMYRNTRLIKDNDSLRMKISTLERIDKLPEFRKIGKKSVDYDSFNNLPNSIKDFLNEKYPNYYIPSTIRKRKIRPNLDVLVEHPFFVIGDFNYDQIDDYVLLLESFCLDRNGEFSSDQRMVVLYSKELSDPNKVEHYDSFEIHHGTGISSLEPIDFTIIKLYAGINYRLYKNITNSYELDKILVVTYEGDVGFVLNWHNNKFVKEYIWNQL